MLTTMSQGSYQLTEPLLWYILSVLDCETAIKTFMEMGGYSLQHRTVWLAAHGNCVPLYIEAYRERLKYFRLHQYQVNISKMQLNLS